ncbi:MAG TPA: hydroxymethylbilane synthase [Deinococcales bacterium]|nr:hydroxymethylbilane synthase [Deinococcales bacterium]
MRQIVVGTRGSTQALAQARWVVARLKEEWPETEFKLVTLPTRSEALELLHRDLEEALVAERIDIAVHNLVDLPVEQPAGIKLSSIPRRLEARDVLVGRSGAKSLASLPEGASVGANTVLRRALLANYRPDLRLIDVRGDVDARLEAIGRGDCDAVILAAAGLIRLELRNRIDEIIDADVLVPTPGQGSLGLETREDDSIAEELAYSLHHHASDDRITAERAFLSGLGAPAWSTAIGALAAVGEDGALTLHGCVAAPDGSRVIRGTAEGYADEAEDVGRELAEDVLKQGGREILQPPAL